MTLSTHSPLPSRQWNRRRSSSSASNRRRWRSFLIYGILRGGVSSFPITTITTTTICHHHGTTTIGTATRTGTLSIPATRRLLAMHNNNNHNKRPQLSRPVRLKPAAIPLMESGKALARAGELWIEWCQTHKQQQQQQEPSPSQSPQPQQRYFGIGNLFATSNKNINNDSTIIINNKSNTILHNVAAVGAQFRNAGDAVAQAGASCRFGTGSELVSDELRRASDCFRGGGNSDNNGLDALLLQWNSLLAEEENKKSSSVENTHHRVLKASAPWMHTLSEELENAGAGIMQLHSSAQVGSALVKSGEALKGMAALFVASQSVSDCNNNTGNVFSNGSIAMNSQSVTSTESMLTDEISQRFAFAGVQMVQAGNVLAGVATPRPTGTSWLKGGA